MKALRPPLLCGAFVFVFVFSAHAQNVIVNGDFEAPPYFPSNTVTGWTVMNNVVEDASEGATSGSYSALFGAGENSQGNMLSQSFTTTPGIIYTLQFDAAVSGQPDSLLQLQVQVTGNMLLLDQTLSPPVSNSFDPGQTFTNFSQYHFTFTFTADSASTTLKFTDIGSANGVADVVLDTVSVMIPEASAIELTIFGAGVLFGFLVLTRKFQA
jgi:hypothetical protein